MSSMADTLKEFQAIDEIFDKEYHEFCDIIDQLDNLGSPVAVIEEATSEGKNVVQKFADLAIQAIRFILKTVGKLGKAIKNIMKKIKGIPDEIRNRVKGNIKLYISVDDIQVLYNQKLMVYLNTYLESIRTILDNAKSSNLEEEYKKLDEVYRKIQNVKFAQSFIDMSDPKIVNTYFSDNRAVDYTSLEGYQRTQSYYEAIYELSNDIIRSKEKLEIIEQRLERIKNESVDDKKDKLSGMIKQTSKVISILGNIVRYLSSDLKTLDKSISKIISASGGEGDTDSSKLPTTQSGTGTIDMLYYSSYSGSPVGFQWGLISLPANKSDEYKLNKSTGYRFLQNIMETGAWSNAFGIVPGTVDKYFILVKEDVNGSRLIKNGSTGKNNLPNITYMNFILITRDRSIFNKWIASGPSAKEITNAFINSMDLTKRDNYHGFVVKSKEAEEFANLSFGSLFDYTHSNPKNLYVKIKYGNPNSSDRLNKSDIPGSKFIQVEKDKKWYKVKT